MQRKAIIVAASPRSQPLPCVYKDLAAWQAFLISAKGGAWTEKEILTATDPDLDQLLQAIRSAADADYSLIIFLGAGNMTETDMPWPESVIHLTNGEKISEKNLNPGSLSCLLLFDFRSAGSASTGHKKTDKSQVENPSHHRDLYDKSINKAEKGLVKIYSIKTSKAGPSLSHTLIESAESWCLKNKGVLTYDEAISWISQSNKRRISNEIEYESGRRLNHFPLAVNP